MERLITKVYYDSVCAYVKMRLAPAVGIRILQRLGCEG